MDIKNIKFSILIPLFNADDYIYRCIESVLSQTYSNYEVIIIDDGSNDNGPKKAQVLAQNNKQISLFLRENKGVLYTRIELISKATGDYIVFLDSDDELEINALQTLYNEINENQCDIVLFSYKKHRTSGAITEMMQYSFATGDYHSTSLLPILIKSDEINSLCMKCVRRELYQSTEIERLKNKSIIMGEDFLISLILLSKECNVCVSNEILYIVNLHENSLCATHNRKRLLSDIELLNYVIDTLKKSELPNDLQTNSRECKIIDDIIEQLLFSENLSWHEVHKYMKYLNNLIKNERLSCDQISTYGRTHRKIKKDLFAGKIILATTLVIAFKLLMYTKHMYS